MSPPPIYINVFSAKWSTQLSDFSKVGTKLLIRYIDQCVAGQQWRLLFHSLAVFCDLFVLYNQWRGRDGPER